MPNTTDPPPDLGIEIDRIRTTLASLVDTTAEMSDRVQRRTATTRRMRITIPPERITVPEIPSLAGRRLPETTRYSFVDRASAPPVDRKS
jgi:hypothetical protein